MARWEKRCGGGRPTNNPWWWDKPQGKGAKVGKRKGKEKVIFGMDIGRTTVARITVEREVITPMHG